MELIDYGARWYDPQIGRFISADIIIPDPANPQSFNRYSYVYNNALRYTDPTGHQCAECLNPQQVPWQDLAKIAGPLVVAAPEVAAVGGMAIMAVGIYVIAQEGPKTVRWVMDDMGPSNPPNPWTGGWTETFPQAGNNPLMAVTTPLPGTNTLGAGQPEGPTIFSTPLEDETKTIGLDFPDFPLTTTSDLPDMSILQGRVIQTGGNKILPRTAQILNEYNDMNLHPREWGRALEALKKAWELPGSHHGNIEEDGTYTDKKGNPIANILDYLP
jgi:hypothetical protein